MSYSTNTRRLEQIEKRIGAGEDSMADKLLAWLREYGCDAVTAMFERATKKSLGIGFYLNMFCGGPFEIERFRGLVPEEEIRKAYALRRGYAYPEEIASKINQLAGLTDAEGDVMPGHVMRADGWIAAAA